MLDTGLKNKVVIVTGANHGIGAATAVAFAKEGVKVFINFLRLSPSEYGGEDRGTSPSCGWREQNVNKV
jgi:3-oxoacyl-[acyl-carrier protein] reductase